MHFRVTYRWLLTALLMTASCVAARSQEPPSAPGNAANTKAAPTASASNVSAAGETSVTPTQLIQFLNQTISWYHQVTIQQEIATEPEEQFTLYDNRQIANQVVKLAFDFARAQADAMVENPASKQPGNSGVTLPQYEVMRRMQAKLDQQYKDTQAELEGDKKKLAAASGGARRKLEAEIPELQAELSLTDARRDAVNGIAQFVSSSASSAKGAAGLRAQIEALGASVPSAMSGAAQSSKEQRPAAAPTSQSNSADLSGIWDLTTHIFGLSSKKGTINSLIRGTDELSASSKTLRGPFVAQLKALSTTGDTLAAEADTANQSMLDQERQKLDSLAAQFRHVSAAVVPLSKQSVLLNLYERNLANWRDIVDARYKSELERLGVRLGFLAILLVILFGLAELWRRAVIRYVQEPRRRHQFLLLRKFVLWFVIVLILAITLAGKLGSVATFAGLLTAGVALALQNVIVAVVGYFLLIGKYGIRVGDRVQAGGTSGEVIDVGLVRFHLMELDKGGTPTGRVVAFSNAIVFQPTAGLFKQIPGTSFAWHEVSAKVSREADFTVVRQKLLEAAENLLQEYHDDIARQYRMMEKTGILVSEKTLRPRVDLRLSSAAIEVTIRYPVDLVHAAEIDARMSRELLETLEKESGTAETPEVSVKTDVPAGGTR